MTLEYNLALNFNNNIPVKTDLTFKQGDKGITLSLATSGLDTTGTTAHIVFKRGNGTSVEAELTGQSGPTYSYTILGNEFEVPGVVVADLKLYNGDTQRVSTASFIFQVTGDTMDGVGGGTGGYSDQLKQLSQEFADTLEQYEEAFADVGAVHAAGNYDPTTEYSPLDLVYYSADNSTYLCVEGCTGETPSPSSQYWQLVVDGSSLSTPDFDDLGDVDMTGVQNGQVPTYNSTTQKYEPGNGGGGSAADITYDNTASKLSATKVQGAVDETNSRITNLYNMTGGKNLNSYPYYRSNETYRGVTYTDNGDGTITLTGQSTDNASLPLHSRVESNPNKCMLPNGTYILTGCPAGGGSFDNGYELIVSITKNGGEVRWEDNGNGVQFTIDGDDNHADMACVGVIIRIGNAGVSFATPVTFKPMIRDASIPDDTYVPYAKTNRELTQEQVKNTDLTSIIATGTTNTTGAQIPNGAYFYLNGVFCRAIADIAVNATFTKNTNYKEVTISNSFPSYTEGIVTKVESLTSGTATSYTTTEDGWYYVLAINSGTSGSCAAFMLASDSTTYIQAQTTIISDYVRATTAPVPLKAGTTIYARAIFTGTGGIYKLS